MRNYLNICHLHTYDDVDLDALPLDGIRDSPQRDISYSRPHIHLCCHRRNIHPDRNTRYRRVARMGYRYIAVVDGYLWDILQVAISEITPRGEPNNIFGYGLDNRDIYANVYPQRPNPTACTHRIGRYFLYPRSLVLRP